MKHHEELQPFDASGLSRRTLLGALGSGLLVATTTGFALPAEAAGGGSSSSRGRLDGRRISLNSRDTAILNFALQLEYLEAEFYLLITGQSTLPQALTDGVGDEGATIPPPAAPTLSSLVFDTAEELARDEFAHVVFLRTILGSRAAAKPTIDFTPAPIPDEDTFLLVARQLEDTGVTAYTGAAPFISNRSVLLSAARILAVEAFHSGNIRLQVIQNGITDVPVAGDPDTDQPTNELTPGTNALVFPIPGDPNTVNFSPTTPEGRSIARTFRQVAAIVEPFFPDGLNAVSRLF